MTERKERKPRQEDGWEEEDDIKASLWVHHSTADVQNQMESVK
jgi:hypothetical protein